MTQSRLFYTFLGLFLLNLPTSVTAQKTPFWRKLHPDSIVNSKLSYLPIPSFSYLPETGIRIGLSLDYFFNTQKESDTISQTRTSFAYGQVAYSTKKQVTLESFWQIYTPNERYFIRGTGGYTDYKEYFWGLGNETLAEKDNTDASYSRYFFQSKFLRNLKGQIFSGLSVNISDTRKIKFGTPDLNPEIAAFSKKSRTYVFGIGPNILFDYRNNPFSPTRGWYADAYWHYYPTSLGNPSNFSELYVDLRKYFPLRGKQMIGIQAIGHFTEGSDIPWRELPRIGGSNMMRGFVSGRYRDNHLWTTQAEYRFPMTRFFMVAVYAGVGGVAHTINAFRLDDTRLGYGLGLRTLINKKKQVYLRADYAFNNNGSTGFYLRAFDAF